MLPYLDLQKQYQSIKEEVLKEVETALDEGIFSEGPSVRKFEKSFAEFLSVKHAVALNSGTSALHLALKSLDLKPDDEVIIPANTFIAAAWAAIYERAHPVFIDCNADTWQMDLDKLASAVSAKTKAIIAVHLYGQPCDIGALKKIAGEKNIALIEDCAHATGALFNDEKVGSFGKIGCFSFYPTKNLGTYGEGGAVITNLEAYEKRIRCLKANGAEEKYVHLETGFNMRMGTIEAAILNVKLRYLTQWNKKRQEIAQHYYDSIDNEKIKLQRQISNSEGVFYLFVVTADDRKAFRDHLLKHNIQSSIHYPIPLHLQPALEYLGYAKGDFPNAEYHSEHCVTLPIFPEMSLEEVNRVIEAINSY